MIVKYYSVVVYNRGYIITQGCSGCEKKKSWLLLSSIIFT